MIDSAGAQARNARRSIAATPIESPIPGPRRAFATPAPLRFGVAGDNVRLVFQRDTGYVARSLDRFRNKRFFSTTLPGIETDSSSQCSMMCHHDSCQYAPIVTFAKCGSQTRVSFVSVHLIGGG